jgi:Raf kinase inhibitor-like YbhB/YbcL family protein
MTNKFTLSSPDFVDGATIPNIHVFNGMGFKGGNVSPALAWSGAPAGTQSFALMLHDPDAPTGSGWWHWVVYDIPVGTSSLPQGAGNPQQKLLPAGAIQGRTDFGTVGYGGPAPPPGTPHHYDFRLHALKVAKLELPPDPTAAMIGFIVWAQQLSVAQLTGMYGV